MTVELTTLPNGVRVVTETMPHLASATIGVWTNVGARQETKAENGIAHMLEHMAFKGTRRRSARDIAEEIEAVGGDLNAFTSREQTVYYARVLENDVPLAFDILSDILLNSVFDQTELERERHVILQEIGQAHDTPDDLIYDLLQDAAYPDQPLGRPILGSAETVSAMSRDALNAYLNKHYRAQNIVVVATGKVDHDAVVTLAEEAFGAVPGSLHHVQDQARYEGGVRGQNRDLEQVHLTLGFDGVSFTDPDFYAVQVYSTVLGGGMSSRLFQEVREVHGLAYSIYSFANSYIDGGTIGVYAGTGPEDMDALLPMLVGEMKKLADSASEEEVARARAQIRAGLMMSLESSASRMEQIGRQVLVYGRALPLEELIASIDEVDVARVTDIAGRMVRSPALSFATVGPYDAEQGFDRLRSLLN
jgi:predicted Zn-dependent peptidase